MSRRRFRPDDAFDEPFDAPTEDDPHSLTGERLASGRDDPPCDPARGDYEADAWMDRQLGHGV